MAKQITIPSTYPVPANWEWVELGKLSIMKSGFPFDSSLFSKDSAGKKPLIRIRDVVNGETMTYTNQDCPDEYIIHKGDILIGMDGDFNVAKWQSEDALLNQRVCYIRSSSKALLDDYLFYYLPTPLRIINENTPSVTVKHLSTKTLSLTPIPLPPFAEQQRIVDRIESLFSKLDEAKEKAQSVIDSYEERKSAILHQAFSGELTKEWRKDNSVAFDSWQKRSVDSICHSLKYGTAKKSEKEGQVVVIRMGNLQQGEIDWTNLSFSTDKEDIEKYRLQPNDVLFNRTNSSALVGKTSIYRGEYPAIYAGYLIKLDYDHEIVLGDYLNYALNTQEAKEYCNTVKTDGVNQSNINAKKIGAYVFTVPTIQEQEKIVDILKNLIEKEKMVKETAERIIKMIDTMKKNILAQAFCGQLETVDTNDEPAERILKKMLSEC